MARPSLLSLRYPVLVHLDDGGGFAGFERCNLQSAICNLPVNLIPLEERRLDCTTEDYGKFVVLVEGAEAGSLSTYSVR